MSKRVFLGVSGGVDSAVSAMLLKSQGYEVVGVHLVVAENSRDTDAKKVCDMVGVQYIECDVQERFQKHIIHPFVESYQNGETPSPCLLCNERIKFKALFSFIESEEDYIATGHYAFSHFSHQFRKKLFLWERESIKDQCYMLYRLSSEIVERAIFPLAGMPKNEVRALAKEFNIPVHSKKDSQNLCFAKEGYVKFLDGKIPQKEVGDIRDIYGKVIGKHFGFQQYTVGQRKGLGINLSSPHFVLSISPQKNELIAGTFEFLEKRCFTLREVVLHVDFSLLSELTLIGRARSSSKGFLGRLRMIEDEYVFEYQEKNSHGAKGQHLVLYSEALELVGGGIINELN